MKKFFPALLLALSLSPAFAQLNVELVANLPYDNFLNDIWGWTAPDGTEYALVGMRKGVSIVSLADPANPLEVQRIEGANSTWRDLRTWGNYAYVVADQPGTKEGLLVIDLSGLPDEAPFQRLRPVYPNSTDTLNTCHNVWVDEQGFAYLTGCNYNPSNVIFLDLNNDPWNTEFAGYGVEVQSHDGYARDGIFYSAEIYEGQFAIYDVEDKMNPKLIGSQTTPFDFCHNVWLSDDGSTAFTTDERANAPTASFDISDLSDIRLLDEFRPLATIGTGVIPHNVHVINDFLAISHYTDGLVIVDAHRPDNLIEVGNWDTSTGFTGGFHGAWGAYPFFPSGLTVISDIENGLFVLNPTYVRASYLHGTVTDADTGGPIAGAEMEILSANVNFEKTDLSGRYRTGQATPGTFEVRFRARGYFDEVASATIASGEITTLDVQLAPLPPHAIAGLVVEKTTGQPIDSAVVFMENADFSYTSLTDANGNFTLPAVLHGEYAVYVGKWGYENFTLENFQLTADDELRIELGEAYEDHFNTGLGWTVSGDATNGLWVRATPNGTFSGTEIFNPATDSPNDPGPRAFVTGNDPAASIFRDQVDGGTTILTSPLMELRSRYNRPMLSYDRWFYNIFSNNAPNDTMVVLVTNGTVTVELERLPVDSNTQVWRPSPVFDLVKLLDITDDMRLIAQVSDRPETPNIVEAGLDHFRITEGIPDAGFAVEDELVKIRVYPNPFASQMTVDYKIEKSFGKLSVQVFDATGRLVDERPLTAPLGSVELRADYPAGVYFVAFRLDNRLSEAVRVAKF